MLPGNQEAIEAWNTILFEKFSRFRHAFSEGQTHMTARALELFPPRGRIVDVGCGFGDTTVDLARRVGDGGRVVGIDAAENFIAHARAEAAGVPNAAFEVLDVEEAVTGGPYDQAFSRFGTMFFNAPVIALRNVRKALVPGGRLCMIVWRKKEANEGFHVAELAVRGILGDPPKGDALTCGPGPFSMASPDLVSDQLHAAGFRDPAFVRFDTTYRIGRTLDEGIDFSMLLGPAGEVVRLAGDAGVAQQDRILAELRQVMSPYMRDDGMHIPVSLWIVTATA